MGNGHVFFYARYVDWSITTALLLPGLCITVVDLLSKIGYGFLTTATTKKVTDADLAQGDVSPALISSPTTLN